MSAIACAGASLARCTPRRSVKEIRKNLMPFSFAIAAKVGHVGSPVLCLRSGQLWPGIQVVPASGTPAMAALSTVSATRSLGLEVQHVAFPAGARDGLQFQRHDAEVIGEPPPRRHRVEAGRQARGPAVVMPAGSFPSCQSS